jgi:hypothetical protein
MLNPKDNSLRTEMLIYSFVCLSLVIIGIVGAISYKLNEDIEVLIFSLTALTCGLGVALAGSLRKDLYDHMKTIENLLQR